MVSQQLVKFLGGLARGLEAAGADEDDALDALGHQRRKMARHHAAERKAGEGKLIAFRQQRADWRHSRNA